MFVLEDSGVEYAANPQDGDSWALLKPTTPTGMLPMVTLADGTVVVESGAILRAAAAATERGPGSGKSFLASETLLGLNADLLKKTFGAGALPTVFTAGAWTAEKTAATRADHVPGILEHVNKYAQFLEPGADKFSESGTTAGEFDPASVQR